MPRRPITESMDSAARSRRSLLGQRQELARVRDNIRSAIDVLLDNGRVFTDLKQYDVADKNFVMAEILNSERATLDKRLARHEEKIKSVVLPQRPAATANPLATPESTMLLTAKTRQEAYAATRAALRPLTDARYGHLARAEKAETAE